MKVSVVTISFNDLAGIRATAESVAGQILPPNSEIEHIVVDGGTEGFVDHFPRSGHLWTSESDGGRYDAMNIGLARATGDWIWWLHSGDTFGSPRAVWWMMEAVRASSDRSWGYGFARLLDADRRVVGTLGTYPFNLSSFSLGGQPVPHQASFFRRDFAVGIGGYDLEHGLAADQRFILRAAMKGPPLFVPEFLCDFDTTGAGSVRPVSLHFRDMRRAVREERYVHPRGRALGWVLSRMKQTLRSGARQVG